jgi:hypothetical protein
MIPAFQSAAYRAKQTQFLDCGLGIKASTPACGPGLRGLVEQTKPNLGKLGYPGDRTGRPAQGKCDKQSRLRRSLKSDV